MRARSSPGARTKTSTSNAASSNAACVNWHENVDSGSGVLGSRLTAMSPRAQILTGGSVDEILNSSAWIFLNSITYAPCGLIDLASAAGSSANSTGVE